MPTQEFSAVIRGLNLRPPNVRPDEGGPRVTLVLNAPADKINLDELSRRVSTQDKKEVTVLLSWEDEEGKYVQPAIPNIAHCEPAAKGRWHCKDEPGKNLLSPCVHYQATADTPDDSEESDDSDKPQVDRENNGAQAALVQCYHIDHPRDAHRETFACIDPEKPTADEFVIYAGDADRAREENPTAAFNQPLCYFDPGDPGDDTRPTGWYCRAITTLAKDGKPIAQSSPCHHIIPRQKEWAIAAGWEDTTDDWLRNEQEQSQALNEDAERREAQRTGPATGAKRSRKGEAVPV